ncbi:hypothetical protein ES703_68893 [subsurface metagenome]
MFFQGIRSIGIQGNIRTIRTYRNPRKDIVKSQARSIRAASEAKMSYPILLGWRIFSNDLSSFLRLRRV